MLNETTNLTKKENNMAGFIVVAVLGAIGLLIFGPFITAWSLNLLFGMGIAYTFQTWLAIVWLSTIVGGTAGGAANAASKK